MFFLRSHDAAFSPLPSPSNGHKQKTLSSKNGAPLEDDESASREEGRESSSLSLRIPLERGLLFPRFPAVQSSSDFAKYRVILDMFHHKNN